MESNLVLPSGPFTFVELFKGKGVVSRSFQSRGFQTWGTDKRKRSGVCEPDLHLPIQKVKRSMIPFEKVNVVWASPPCTGFSYGAGDFYFKERKPKANAKQLIECTDFCLDLITEMCPDLFFIENPRGHLRYYKIMIDWLAKMGGMLKPITMSSYGGLTTKPSDIFTNCYVWTPKPLDPYGRGAKNPGLIKSLSSLTKVKQQETPKLLADELADLCLDVLTKKYGNHSVPVIKSEKCQDHMKFDVPPYLMEFP